MLLPAFGLAVFNFSHLQDGFLHLTGTSGSRNTKSSTGLLPLVLSGLSDFLNHPLH